MRRYAAYIRVSTVRQGERGVSLPEQRSIIDGYARREGLSVAQWYEERETAARIGRTQFRAMLRELRRGRLDGLILHKIDRGARNLSDWAALSELADQGIDVRIAGDTLDLGSRGGRLSADIQAVVAADYIRNLREEVKKGQRGRLKQGLYPWAAPIGYLDTGTGKPKAIDPISGPLIRRAFEAYATGEHSIRTLRVALAEWGLTKRIGKPLSRNVVNAILRRPFYYGLIEVGPDAYAGAHEPIVTKELWDQVQDVLDGRLAKRSYEERTYVFRRLLTCTKCGRHLYAEIQKGHTYYRCHTDGCQGTCVRETAVLRQVLDVLGAFPVTARVIDRFNQFAKEARTRLVQVDENSRAADSLRRAQLQERMERLTDAFLDRAIDRSMFEGRKRLLEDERLALPRDGGPSDRLKKFDEKVAKCLELLKALKTLDETATESELRATVKASVSNFLVDGKYVEIAWDSTVRKLFVEEPDHVGPHVRDGYRTIQAGRAPHCKAPLGDCAITDLVKRLVDFLYKEATS